MSIRLDRLEACYQANKDRRIGQTWDCCLIGGYSQDIVTQIRAIGASGEPLTQVVADTYQFIAEHFGMPLEDAKLIFGTGNLNRLREFIDANTPKLAQMDYKEPHAPKECLAQPLCEVVDHA